MKKIETYSLWQKILLTVLYFAQFIFLIMAFSYYIVDDKLNLMHSTLLICMAWLLILEIKLSRLLK